MKQEMRGAPMPSAALQDSFIITDPKKRSHRYVGDCAVLAVSIVQGWSYEATGRLMAPFMSDGTHEIGITGGDLTRVLGRFGFKPVRFHFPVSLLELWNTGFFEIQKIARRVAVVCTKAGPGSHTLAFIHGRFYGDFLPETHDVQCVFLKPQKDV